MTDKKMKGIPIKTRELAMKEIIDYYALHGGSNSFITVSYLDYKGVSKKIDSKTITDVLVAMGFLEYGSGIESEAIFLTSKGKSYFETKEDEKIARKRQFSHDWKVAIISATIGALASEPIWRFIHYLVEIFTNQ